MEGKKKGKLAVKEIKLIYAELENFFYNTAEGLIYKQKKGWTTAKINEKLEKSKKDQETALQNEIKICKALVHPNIVKTYEGFRINDATYKRVYIAMELCTGGDLFDVIDKENDELTYLPLVCVKKIIQQIISALVYAHEQGYVHRDLKPENILLVTKYTYRGRTGKVNLKRRNTFPDIKVADWGLATTKTTLSNCSKHHKCLKKGTRGFMAPEIFGGNYNEEVDLWAVGIILGTLLTNKDVLPSKKDGSYHNLTHSLPNAIEFVEKELNSRPKKGNEEEWGKKVSAWMTFLTNLLKISPRDRVTAAAADDDDATTGMYHQYVAVKF